jgi:DNA modification methylase
VGSWDKDRLPREAVEAILAKGGDVIIFGGNYYADLLPVGKHWLVWDKLNTMPTFGDCELAWTNIKRQSVKKITREYNGLIGKEGDRFHPTQKPLNLFKNIVAIYSKPGAIVGDFCLGSGTTAVAAKELGRKFIGIEVSEEYCAIAVKRLRQGVLDFG